MLIRDILCYSQLGCKFSGNLTFGGNFRKISGNFSLIVNDYGNRLGTAGNLNENMHEYDVRIITG